VEAIQQSNRLIGSVSPSTSSITSTPAEEGGFVVTSPLEPELITEAETIEEAFRIAQDALRALRTSRVKLLRKLERHQQAMRRSRNSYPLTVQLQVVVAAP
jgi:predicted RNase H-like HicB family nuclease